MKEHTFRHLDNSKLVRPDYCLSPIERAAGESTVDIIRPIFLLELKTRGLHEDVTRAEYFSPDLWAKIFWPQLLSYFATGANYVLICDYRSMILIIRSEGTL